MTSNLKKLARERQAKTGESYAAARAALFSKRQPPQSFTAIVMKVISLATTAFTASAARGPHDLVELALGGRLPEEQALEDYLEALPAVTLRKLEALMYLGRDHRSDVLATGQVSVSALDLPGRFSDASSDPERNVERMTSKFPLPDYLREGLACCIYIGFNVERADWSEPQAGVACRSFALVVQDVMALAEERRNEDARLFAGASSMAEKAEVIKQQSLEPEPFKGASALSAFLESLPHAMTRKLETLMYVGREDAFENDPVPYTREDVVQRFMHAQRDKEQNVASMMNKFVLADYLRAGIACCEREGFDVEAACWTAEAE